MATTEQNTTVKKQRSVIIIGAGWAGLAAAVKLIHAGYKVTLLESARQVGGRARRVAFNKLRVDNGQHLLIGAYQDTLELMSFLKIDPAEKLLRQSLSLTSYYKNGKSVSLSTANIIAPLHLFVGLLRAGGLSLRERVHALLFGRRLFMHGFKFKNDISVEAMMQRYKQPAGLCEKLWYPLCIAIMNTSPQLASAQIFLRVLFDSFKGSNESSDFLFTRDDLSSLLPDPAVEYIEKNGGSVKLGQRVTALDVNEHNSISVQVDEQDYHAEHVIIATTPHACNSLIMNIPALKQLAHDLSKFNYEPIVTVYLQYPEQTKLPQHMIGLIDCTTQWLFDRRIYDQPGLMAAVISSSGPHMELDNDALAQQVQNEIATLFPDWPKAEDVMIIREKRATFSCRHGINNIRPDNTTAINNLWLAGDYTNTGYPATLEGAVRSGLQCAELIIQQQDQQRDTNR